MSYLLFKTTEDGPYEDTDKKYSYTSLVSNHKLPKIGDTVIIRTGRFKNRQHRGMYKIYAHATISDIKKEASVEQKEGCPNGCKRYSSFQKDAGIEGRYTCGVCGYEGNECQIIKIQITSYEALYTNYKEFDEPLYVSAEQIKQNFVPTDRFNAQYSILPLLEGAVTIPTETSAGDLALIVTEGDANTDPDPEEPSPFNPEISATEARLNIGSVVKRRPRKTRKKGAVGGRTGFSGGGSPRRRSSNPHDVGKYAEEHIVDKLKKEHSLWNEMKFDEKPDVVHESKEGNKPGWDISCNFDGGRKIAVEVKGTELTEFSSCELTPNEWKAAKRLNSDYFLCLVANVGKPSVTAQLIRDPYNNIEWKPSMYEFDISTYHL